MTRDRSLLQLAMHPPDDEMVLSDSKNHFALQNCLLYEDEGDQHDDQADVVDDLGAQIDAQQLLFKRQLLVRLSVRSPRQLDAFSLAAATRAPPCSATSDTCRRRCFLRQLNIAPCWASNDCP